MDPAAHRPQVALLVVVPKEKKEPIGQAEHKPVLSSFKYPVKGGIMPIIRSIKHYATVAHVYLVKVIYIM